MGKIITQPARFVLKKANPKTGKSLILLICRTCVPRLVYSTGKMIDPKLWDTTTQRPKVNKQGIDRATKDQLKEVEVSLNRMADTAQRLNSRVLNERIEPTPNFYRAEFDKEFNFDRTPKAEPAPALEKLTLFPWIEKFIKECADGERTIKRTGKRFSNASIKNYRKTQKALIGFAKETRTRLDFDSINLHFYQKFLTYLNKKGKATNTKGGHIKYLKVFMRQSLKDGLHDNRIYEDMDFVKPVEEVENIYLTTAEIQQIYDLDLSARAGLDRVRDLFIIGCNTGLRFSDLSQLRPDNFINDGKFVRITMQKTSKPVFVPITPQVRAILSKYKGVPPRALTNQKMNEALKEIAQLAGLNEPVTTTQTKGGLKVTKTVTKWQMVTTHTARRSFATNAYKSGVPTIDIMRLTGHSTESSFMKYIKLENEEVAHRMAEHPFFKQESAPIFKIAN